MAENGEDKLIAVARHIAKTLGRTETMADDIYHIFSTFDGRFSMVVAGFGKECAHAYSICRRDFLEESISRLGLRLGTSEAVQGAPWSDVEEEIGRWTKAINVAVCVLFPSERCLCDRVFACLAAAADLSFAEACRGPVMQLLAFPDAVAVGGRAPERLFRILDAYDALRDLIPEIDSV